MNINTENIDEYLFDYFEGEMTPQQGDALMDFIHQNPIYEKDFVQWKKSYHHKEQEVISYDMSSRLKAIAKVPFYAHHWFRIAIPSLVILCGVFIWNVKTDAPVKNPTMTISSPLKKEQKPSSRSDAKTYKTEPLKQKVSVIEHNKTKPKINKPLVLIELNDTLPIDTIFAAIIQIDSLAVSNEIVPEIMIVDSVSKTDSILPEENLIEENIPVNKKEKRRNKRTNNTIPINPNF